MANRRGARPTARRRSRDDEAPPPPGVPGALADGPAGLTRNNIRAATTHVPRAIAPASIRRDAARTRAGAAHHRRRRTDHVTNPARPPVRAGLLLLCPCQSATPHGHVLGVRRCTYVRAPVRLGSRRTCYGFGSSGVQCMHWVRPGASVRACRPGVVLHLGALVLVLLPLPPTPMAYAPGYAMPAAQIYILRCKS